MLSSPLKVAAVSATSQPELSQVFASAHINHTVGEAVPELQRTLSDLDLHSPENGRSSSSSSCERTPRPDYHTNGLVRPRTRDGLRLPELTATPKRNPLGSRRSTISASATTTSLNLEPADSISVSSSVEGASGILSKSAGSRAPEHASRSRKRYIDVSTGENGRGESSRSLEKENRRSVLSTQELRNGNTVSKQGSIEPGHHSESFPQGEKGSCKQSPANSITYPDRRYFILTSAGKPVFCSHTADEESLTRMMGVAQAIISIHDEDGDKLQSITHGRMKITFLLGDPLYLFCVSEWNEPDFVLRCHLEYLYLQTISIVTSSQLIRMFQRRSNFDLRRLLDGRRDSSKDLRRLGSEPSLYSLIGQMQSDFTFFTSSLQPLRMSPFLREAAANALVPPTKISELLYVLLIADDKIVTLLRPRKHSIHPTDLHLLLNVLSSSPALRTAETWLPICLPKFNPGGFVYAFISYIRENLGMVFISADRDGFDSLREWRDGVLEKLEKTKVLGKLEAARSRHEYSVADLEIPGVRHFWYKSRRNVQITMPRWDSPYTPNSTEQKRLITLYQHVYDGIHAKSGPGMPLKQYYVQTEYEACMGWSTQPFELYLTVSPSMPKNAVVSAANSIARWINKEEAKLFLRDAPVF
ncbi:hypothetical protein QFC20_007671 [Naganishia adeliensis]|uniref:Uncharacterized protein n=1 Tax=Naganishia adeliensis TaxID=92952 RepID=A0ACC2UWH7_9TREE|nr:hypothetical protein QFC20_007671 [Naganishia adeliensis]